MINSKSTVQSYKKSEKVAKVKFSGLKDGDKPPCEEEVLITRMQKIRDELSYLKMNLSMEKENLARERYEAAMAVAAASSSSMMYNYYPSMEQNYQMNPYHYTNTFNPAEAQWNMQAAWQFRNYANKYLQQSASQRDGVVPHMSTSIKELLSRAETVCSKDLVKMQKDIADLRKAATESVRSRSERESLARNKDDNLPIKTWKAGDGCIKAERTMKNERERRKKLVNKITMEERLALERLRNMSIANPNTRKIGKKENVENFINLKSEESGHPVKSSHSLWCFDKSVN